VRGKLYKISSYLNAEELRVFKLGVKARGLTESMYIREMLSFDVRPRGAPKGKREKISKVKSAKSTKPARGAAKSRSSKKAAGKKRDDSAVKKDTKEQLSFLE
jgi:hypothetical protein